MLRYNCCGFNYLRGFLRIPAQIFLRGRNANKSLGGVQQRRSAGAELIQQSPFIGLGGREVPHLDVAEAADLLRDGGEADRDVVVVGRESSENLGELRLIVGNQLALGPALLGVAED